MIQKQTYTAPEAETLVIRFEGMICLSGDGNPNAWTAGNNNWFEDDD